MRHVGEANRAVGQVLHMEDSAMSLVGMLPVGFHFPLKSALWFPLPWENTNRTAHNYRVLALLKPGVTTEAVRTYLSTVRARLQQAFPSTHKDELPFNACSGKWSVLRGLQPRGARRRVGHVRQKHGHRPARQNHQPSQPCRRGTLDCRDRPSRGNRRSKKIPAFPRSTAGHLHGHN